MSMVTVLTLRSPENAARAMEVGYGTLAIQALQRFLSSGQTQKQACLMIRNLVVRNPENRYAVELTHLSFWHDNLCRISLASIEISGWHSNAISQCRLQHIFTSIFQCTDSMFLHLTLDVAIAGPSYLTMVQRSLLERPRWCMEAAKMLPRQPWGTWAWTITTHRHHTKYTLC